MDERQDLLQGTGDEPIGQIARDLERLEREKYEKVWEDDRYRRYSPGEGLVHEAFMSMNMKPGDSLIDYGCGTGRALEHFIGWGLTVTGVDIAENCMETDVNFVRACLWNLPDLQSTWGYCTDVMEHIPEEMVLPVLEQIAERSERGVFFQIALTKDASGPLILGEPLHLTVKPMDWWFDVLSQFWQTGVIKRGTGMIARCYGTG